MPINYRTYSCLHCTYMHYAICLCSYLVTCYIPTLPLLFLIRPYLLTHLSMRLLISGTVLLLSLTSAIPFSLTLLIFFLALLLNLLISALCYALGLIPLIISLSSALIVLTETPQSFGSQLSLIRLTHTL
jgi:hypothetical protein